MEASWLEMEALNEMVEFLDAVESFIWDVKGVICARQRSWSSVIVKIAQCHYKPFH